MQSSLFDEDDLTIKIGKHRVVIRRFGNELSLSLSHFVYFFLGNDESAKMFPHSLKGPS